LSERTTAGSLTVFNFTQGNKNPITKSVRSTDGGPGRDIPGPFLEDAMKRLSIQLLAGAAFMAAAGITAMGSSHREAPGITGRPKLDGTDFYAFRSYEPGREGYVTLIANYIPLQDAYGGPNFFAMDPNALYEIHVDNDGDAREDLTFQFRFRTTYRNLAVNAGGTNVAVPLINIGQIGPNTGDTGNLNALETYTVRLIRGDRRDGRASSLRDAATGNRTFTKPADRIGDKSIPNYAQYADKHIYDVTIPGCSNGRVFAGQRREGFVVDLAEVFDLVNLNPLGPVDGTENVLADKNVTSLAVEVPVACLKSGSDPVIGAWTTASERVATEDENEEAWRQLSRLGHPLVNEVVIGLKDKDRFNGSEPKHDAQFAKYVTNPTLPVLINALFGVPAPATPRNDLVSVFLTGVPGLNKPASVTPSEMLRLNTSIAVKAPAAQSPFGVLGGDTAGFPNGRRPGDDVVDIALRAVEGVLLPGHPAAVEQLTDGAFSSATVNYTPDGAVTGDATFSLFRSTFPYLQTPLSGSPGPIHP
jgi:hypothetical protein